MNKDGRNLSMLMDLYEMTMSNGIMDTEYENTVAYFDMFFRKVPDNGGYAIMAGIEQLIDYFNNLKFDKSDIEYLKGLNLFSDRFIEYLENFRFSCDVWAVPEGTPIFPHEPIVTVRGPVMQAMMVETFLLLCINHQSLIATKSNRIVRAAAGHNGKAKRDPGPRRAAFLHVIGRQNRVILGAHRRDFRRGRRRRRRGRRGGIGRQLFGIGGRRQIRIEGFVGGGEGGILPHRPVIVLHRLDLAYVGGGGSVVAVGVQVFAALEELGQLAQRQHPEIVA